MALFDITRTISKSNDIAIAKKSTKTKKVATTIRGGSNLLVRIQNIQKLVDEKLGHLNNRYILIQDEKILEDYIDKCLENKVIAIDTETTGLDPMLDEIVGICIYTPGEKAAYIPINHISYITNDKLPNQLEKDIIREKFERIAEEHIDVIMFNADFDIRVLRNQLGLHNIYCTWDCYIAQRLLNENEPDNRLKPLHQKYVLDGKEDEFTFSNLFKGITFDLIPLNTALLYAGHDPEVTYEFYDYQRKYLTDDTDREDLRNVYNVMKNIEMPCVSVVADMEDSGILLDLDFQSKLAKKYHKLLDDKLKEIYTEIDKYKDEIDEYNNGYHEEVVNHSGQVQSFDDVKTGRLIKNKPLDNPINISSPTQLSILFYDILKIGVIDKKTPRGTGEDILKKIDIPLAKLILDYRGIEKLINTYIDKLPNCINPNDNRIHCKFNQYGADTGRMSSSNPNLQNIPSHNKDIRKMFVATNECVEVIEHNNSFVVDKWSEINTIDGWKSTSRIVVGDILIVTEDATQLEIIVSNIETAVDKNQIIIYY